MRRRFNSEAKAEADDATISSKRGSRRSTRRVRSVPAEDGTDTGRNYEETGGWLLFDVVQLWTNPMREERIGSNSRIGVQLRIMFLIANFM